jgi:hypothetical protein
MTTFACTPMVLASPDRPASADLSREPFAGSVDSEWLSNCPAVLDAPKSVILPRYGTPCAVGPPLGGRADRLVRCILGVCHAPTSIWTTMPAAS